MKLDELQIWVSPITNEIYAGFVSKDGITAKQKVNVTSKVLRATMEYMDKEDAELKSQAGILKFERSK